MHSDPGASLGMYIIRDVIPESFKLLKNISIGKSHGKQNKPLDDMCQKVRRVALSAELNSGDQIRDSG